MAGVDHFNGLQRFVGGALDVAWLEVGHVDEIISTILANNNPCGFSLIKADPLLYLKLIYKNLVEENLEIKNNLNFYREIKRDKNLVMKLLKMPFDEFDYSKDIKKINS